jgi:hypothetical protein
MQRGQFELLNAATNMKNIIEQTDKQIQSDVYVSMACLHESESQLD